MPLLAGRARGPPARSGTRSRSGARASRRDRPPAPPRRPGRGAPPTRSSRPAGRAAARRTGRLAVEVETEAVQEPVVEDRQAAPPQALASGVEPDPHRQPVLPGQRPRSGRGRRRVRHRPGSASPGGSVSARLVRADLGAELGDLSSRPGQELGRSRSCVNSSPVSSSSEGTLSLAVSGPHRWLGVVAEQRQVDSERDPRLSRSRCMAPGRRARRHQAEHEQADDLPLVERMTAG